MPPASPHKRVNWEIAKACLGELNQKAPVLLKQGVIIGGIACWFYRHLLDSAKDADFKVPTFSPTQEAHWLSKDIDFTNFFSEDARNLLKEDIVVGADGRRALTIAGVPIGFAQVGLTFDPETAWADSWVAKFDWKGVTVECRVLDPLSLYREKLALVQRRGAESDSMHCAVVTEFLRLEVCKQAAMLGGSLEERSLAIKFLIGVRDRALEVCRDSRVSVRLRNSAHQLTPSEEKLLNELSAAIA